MIDVHCHILPEIDDGSKTMEESIKMAKIASEEGIKKIISTSHFHPESKFIMGKELENKIENLNYILKENKIDVEVYIGNEIYYTQDLLSKLDELGFYTLNNSRYVLIEFSPIKFPENLADIVYEFKLKGYIPVLAHIERYSDIVKSPNLVYDYINEGALIQVNASSIVGKNGKEVKKLCDILLDCDMIHFVGTDAHGSDKRRPLIKDAYYYTEEKIGVRKAKKIFYSNPQNMINNEGIVIIEPKKYRKKGILGRIFNKY